MSDNPTVTATDYAEYNQLHNKMVQIGERLKTLKDQVDGSRQILSVRSPHGEPGKCKLLFFPVCVPVHILT